MVHPTLRKSVCYAIVSGCVLLLPLISSASLSGQAPFSVSLGGGVSGGTSPYTYSWTFGDGTGGSGQNISHTYSTAGTFTATLNITDSLSHTASTQQTVTVSSPVALPPSPTPPPSPSPLPPPTAPLPPLATRMQAMLTDLVGGQDPYTIGSNDPNLHLCDSSSAPCGTAIPAWITTSGSAALKQDLSNLMAESSPLTVSPGSHTYGATTCTIHGDGASGRGSIGSPSGTTLTRTNGDSFTALDTGLAIRLFWTDTSSFANQFYSGTATFVDANHVTLSPTPSFTSGYTDLTWGIGTDDTDCAQAAVNAGSIHFVGPYKYVLSGGSAGKHALIPPSNRTIVCDTTATLLQILGGQYSDIMMFGNTNGQGGESDNDVVANCTFSGTNSYRPVRASYENNLTQGQTFLLSVGAQAVNLMFIGDTFTDSFNDEVTTINFNATDHRPVNVNFIFDNFGNGGNGMHWNGQSQSTSAFDKVIDGPMLGEQDTPAFEYENAYMHHNYIANQFGIIGPQFTACTTGPFSSSAYLAGGWPFGGGTLANNYLWNNLLDNWAGLNRGCANVGDNPTDSHYLHNTCINNSYGALCNQ